MKVSREQMAENRVRILNASTHLFRDRGFDAVTVSEVMKAAGLTHGGFYGHFASKDDLIARAVAHALTATNGEGGDLGAWMDAYLSPHHRDSAATGCPNAALAGLLHNQSPEARAAMTEGQRIQIERLTGAIPAEGSLADDAERRTAAIGSWAAMVGAVILSRAISDPDLSDEVLASTRRWIDQAMPD